MRLASPLDEVLEEWRRRDALRGSEVHWDGGAGTAAGVDDDGSLLVDTDSGRVALAAGEVHLGPLEGATTPLKFFLPNRRYLNGHRGCVRPLGVTASPLICDRRAWGLVMASLYWSMPMPSQEEPVGPRLHQLWRSSRLCAGPPFSESFRPALWIVPRAVAHSRGERRE